MNKKDNVILITMIILIAIVWILFVKCIDSRVDKKGYIYSIDNNVITVVDLAGDAWEWELEEGEEFTVGQHVILVMKDNGTKENEKDDIILKIKLDKFYSNVIE